MPRNDKLTTIPVSIEVGELIVRLADKKAKELNLPHLSQRQYAEQVFRDLADKELL